MTEFRELMQTHFGPVRAASVARDHVFAAFGDRNADDAITAGFDVRDVWFAICDTFEVPESMRYGLPDEPEAPRPPHSP